MRLKAIKDLKIKEVPVKIVSGLTEKQKQEFIIKDNVGFGEWDWDMLANEWEAEELEDWGLDVWQNNEEEIDYSILDNEDIDGQIDEMQQGVKKAIQIEFDLEHYEEAQELVKFWREQDAYVGAMLIEKLKYFFS